MGFFVRVFEWKKDSSLPHQIFSWKFYFYETKIILGRPALTISLRRPVASHPGGGGGSELGWVEHYIYRVWLGCLYHGRKFK